MYNIENILKIDNDKVSNTVHSNAEEGPRTIINKSSDDEKNAKKTSAKRSREVNAEEEHGNLKKQKQKLFDAIPTCTKELPSKIINYIVNKFEKTHKCEVESCNLEEFLKEITENNEHLIAEKEKQMQQFDPQSQLKKRPREDSENCGDKMFKKMKRSHEFEVIASSSKDWPQQVNSCTEDIINVVKPKNMNQTNSMKRPREESADDKSGKANRAKQNNEDDVIIIDEDDPNVITPNSEIIVGVFNNKMAVPNIPTYVSSGEIREMLQHHYIINNQQMIFKMTEPELFASRYNEQMEIAHVRDIHKYPNIEMSFRRLQYLYNTHPRYAPENIHKIKIPPFTLGHVDHSAYLSAHRSSENNSASLSSETPTPVASFNINSLLNLPKD